MAQTTKSERYDNGGAGFQSENIEVNVPFSGLTTVAELLVAGYKRAFIQMTVTDHDLDQFVLSVQATKNSPFTPILSSTAEFLSPGGIILGVSGDLTKQAVNTVGSIIIDTTSFYSLKIEVSSANAAGSKVNVYAGGSL